MKNSYPDWLPDALLYQIFPASFQDSNGDGIGDLNGVTRKLDHIAELGFNTVWLCPIYDSPFRDAGYDVRNYRQIAERYGTMEDFERLVSEAHARGLRLILDFVPGHTSDEHPWFQESCTPDKNPYSNRYIWSDQTFYAEGKFKSPGQFINGYADRIGNYMANFFYFQPALNFGYADPDPAQPWQLPVDHPDVIALKNDMFDIMRFWLDKGIDGFRVDMAGSLIKGFDPNAVQEAMTGLWSEVRAWWDRDYPDALLLAEWSNPEKAIACGFQLDFMIHFDRAGGMKPFRGENTRTIIHRDDTSYFDQKGGGCLDAFWTEFHQHRSSIQGQGFLSIPSGNHDLPRYSVDRSAADLKVIQTFLMTLPHVPTFYYGDEIGMRDQGDLPSKEGAYNRTGARTPMQWDESEQAGFSSADPSTFYLPVDEHPQGATVSTQKGDPDSLLEHFKRLAQFRRAHPALGSEGSLQVIDTGSVYPLLYLRTHEQDAALVVLNPLPTSLEIPFTLEGQAGETQFGPTKVEFRSRNQHLAHIPPVSSTIVKWTT